MGFNKDDKLWIYAESEIWIYDTVNFRIRKGSDSEKYYLELVEKFPPQISKYWMIRTAHNIQSYRNNISAKSIMSDPYRELEAVKKICKQIELLQEETGIYQKVLNELNTTIHLLNIHKHTTETFNSTLKDNDKPSRTKQTFYQDSFLLNTYLDIYYPYNKRKMKFIKDDFYNYMTEIYIYMGLIPNICSNNGKSSFRFYWNKGKKVIENNTNQFDSVLFSCAYFGHDTERCSLLNNRQVLKRLCNRRDNEHEYTYNYIKDRLNVIIKKTYQFPDYYAITVNNKSFILRILYDQLISD